MNLKQMLSPSFFKIKDWFAWRRSLCTLFYFDLSTCFFNLTHLHWLYLWFDLVVCFDCLDTKILQCKWKFDCFFFNFFNWFFFNFIHQYFILFYFYVKFGPYFSNYYLFCFSLFFIDYFFNSIPQHFIDWGFDFVIFVSLPSMKLVTISWFGSQVLKISLSWLYFFRSFLKTNIFF
jgi:hypothetical protein